MGKPWGGKGGKGHRDGLGLLHGLARRYQEQQQLTMLGPMLASAGFGQSQGIPAHTCQQPQAVPVMMVQNPALPQVPANSFQYVPQGLYQNPPVGQSQPHHFTGATVTPAAGPTATGFEVPDGSAMQKHETSNAILSTLTAVGSSLQKLVNAFSSQEPQKPKPNQETEAAQSAMKGEPTELLHDLLRLAKSRTHEQDKSQAKPSRKRAAQEPDEAAILSIIDSVLGGNEDEERDADGDVKERLANKISEAIKSGELAAPKKRARQPKS